MSIADNKQLARRYFDDFTAAAIDTIPRLLAKGQVSHLPGAPQGLDWPTHKQYASVFFSAFPGSRMTIHDQVADAANVVSRFTFRGTHNGAFMGIPATGREVAVAGISWFRIEDGLIAEEWTQFDRLGLMVQLGAAGAPPPPGTLVEAQPDRPEQLAPLTSARAVVGRWFERIDRGGAPDVDQYVVKGYVDHNPPPIQGLGSGVTGVRQVFSFALTAFTEFHHEIAASIAEDDKVASRVTGFGKHTGDFLGIAATGRKVNMSGITIHRIADGKLAEHWAQIDAMSLLQQMGAIPANV